MGGVKDRVTGMLKVVLVALVLSLAFSVDYIWDELDSVDKKIDSQQRRIDAQYQVILKQAQIIDALIHEVQRLNGIYTEVQDGKRMRSPKDTHNQEKQSKNYDDIDWSKGKSNVKVRINGK